MKIRHRYVSPGHNYFGHHGGWAGTHPILEVPQIEGVASHGIRGDRRFDFKENYQGQITFFALEVHQELGRELPLAGRSAAGYRRNVITEGADLNSLIGSEFEVQGVRFCGRSECSPCHWMDQASAAGAEKFLQSRGGLRATILTDGMLHADS